jgi:hypothetical protein
MDKNNLVESNGDRDLNFCNRCVYGKHHHTLGISFEWCFSCKEILGLVHIDLCGSMAITSHGGA